MGALNGVPDETFNWSRFSCSRFQHAHTMLINLVSLQDLMNYMLSEAPSADVCL